MSAWFRTSGNTNTDNVFDHVSRPLTLRRAFQFDEAAGLLLEPELASVALAAFVDDMLTEATIQAVRRAG